MSLQVQRSKSVGKTTRINASKSGLSLSKRVGPLTLNTRGRGSLRVAKGVSFRFGKKDAPLVAVAMLAAGVMVLAWNAAVFVLRAAVLVSLWMFRWVWFGAVHVVGRLRSRNGPANELPAAPPAS